MADLLVFTDLDGTLLDHHSYSYEAALPALKRLAAESMPVIFNSSKTAAEIGCLRNELRNDHPFIVENGSAVCVPVGYFEAWRAPKAVSVEDFDVHTFGASYKELIHQLHSLRKNAGYLFRGFADMNCAELALLTGLDETSAALAQQRNASEPMLWEDSDAALRQFRHDLQECKLTLVQGGRFYHVMGQVDKAEALRWLTERYQQAWPGRDWVTVALGDGPNDQAMLEAADLAVVMPPFEGKPLQLNRERDVLRPKESGPRGWQSAMMSILNRETDKGV